MGTNACQCTQRQLRAVVLYAQMRSNHLDQTRVSKRVCNLRGCLV